ncbi:MAG: SoxR reducing system RseC family protein [Cellvibrionaceae bacterium]|nr:SoxR reducing system RseC family protein [Cellvibrionaceae bacterium]
MITEKATIVAIEDDALWVSTIQQSTCHRCTAKAGCGQGVIKRLSLSPSYLRVVPGNKGAQHYRVGDALRIAIPDDIVVKSALIVYILPLFCMLVLSGFAHTFWRVESLSAVAAAMGLCIGGWLVKLYSHYHRADPRHQPFIAEPWVISRSN